MTPARLDPARLPDANGHFGRFGGRFVPETLMSPLIELERAFRAAWRDAGPPGPVSSARSRASRGAANRSCSSRASSQASPSRS